MKKLLVHVLYLVPIVCSHAAMALNLEELQICQYAIAPLTEGDSYSLFNGMTVVPDPDNGGFWIYEANHVSRCNFQRDRITTGLVHHYKITVLNQEPFYIKYAESNSGQPAKVLESSSKPLGRKGTIHNNEMICGRIMDEQPVNKLSEAIEVRIKKVDENFLKATSKQESSKKIEIRKKYREALEKCSPAFGATVKEQLGKIGVNIGGAQVNGDAATGAKAQ